MNPVCITPDATCGLYCKFILFSFVQTLCCHFWSFQRTQPLNMENLKIQSLRNCHSNELWYSKCVGTEKQNTWIISVCWECQVFRWLNHEMSEITTARLEWYKLLHWHLAKQSAQTCYRKNPLRNSVNYDECWFLIPEFLSSLHQLLSVFLKWVGLAEEMAVRVWLEVPRSRNKGCRKLDKQAVIGFLLYCLMCPLIGIVLYFVKFSSLALGPSHGCKMDWREEVFCTDFSTT